MSVLYSTRKIICDMLTCLFYVCTCIIVLGYGIWDGSKCLGQGGSISESWYRLSM